jgi:hypothetical protein
MRFDITTRQWHELIRPVLPHASNDADTPELAAIRIEAADNVVYAVATDRYTLGVERLPADMGRIGFAPVHLRLPEVQASLKLFTYAKDYDPQLRIIIDTVPVPIGQVGRTVTIDHLAATIESDDGTRLVLHDVRQPDRDAHASWRKIIRGLVSRNLPASAPALTINAGQLGRWAAAVRKGERLSVFTGAEGNEIMLVLVEDHFAGAWQPQSYLEGGDKMLAESPWLAELEPIGE